MPLGNQCANASLCSHLCLRRNGTDTCLCPNENWVLHTDNRTCLGKRWRVVPIPMMNILFFITFLLFNSLMQKQSFLENLTPISTLFADKNECLPNSGKGPCVGGDNTTCVNIENGKGFRCECRNNFTLTNSINCIRKLLHCYEKLCHILRDVIWIYLWSVFIINYGQLIILCRIKYTSYPCFL